MGKGPKDTVGSFDELAKLIREKEEAEALDAATSNPNAESGSGIDAKEGSTVVDSSGGLGSGMSTETASAGSPSAARADDNTGDEPKPPNPEPPGASEALAQQITQIRHQEGQLAVQRHNLKRTKEAIANRRHELSQLRHSLLEEIQNIREQRHDIQVTIVNARKLTGHQNPINDIGEVLSTLESAKAELAKRLSDFREREAALEEWVQSLTIREEKVAKGEDRHKKQLRISRELRAYVRELEAENNAKDREIRSLKGQRTRLARELDAQHMLMETVEAARPGIAWMLAHAAEDDAATLRPDVVLVGSGPIDHAEMHSFLENRGIAVWAPDSEGVPLMIVGEEDWSEEELEMQIAAQEGDILKAYSQEMALLALAAGADPLDSANKDTLQAFAANHPALQFLRDSELMWPLTRPPSLPEEFTPFDHEDRGVDESPLKKMGYTVGKTHGIPSSARQKLLTHAFTASLPHTHSEEYMAEWGRPRTRRRLWRISHHLAWLARSWKRMHSHRYAVEDWTRDLGWLEKQYYRPWMRFAWPHVRVPGKP